MIWLLLGVAMVVVTLGLLVAAAWRAWRKARRTLSATGELRDRVAALAAQAGELSAQLDMAEATAQYASTRRP